MFPCRYQHQRLIWYQSLALVNGSIWNLIDSNLLMLNISDFLMAVLISIWNQNWIKEKIKMWSKWRSWFCILSDATNFFIGNMFIRNQYLTIFSTKKLLGTIVLASKNLKKHFQILGQIFWFSSEIFDFYYIKIWKLLRNCQFLKKLRNN